MCCSGVVVECSSIRLRVHCGVVMEQNGLATKGCNVSGVVVVECTSCVDRYDNVMVSAFNCRL